jgi:glycosyltransferase involved in cell wall biosynthesis
MPKGFGTSMAHISLCMIVKNEAPHLAQCLDSAQPLADEIIIVDTGSTDATPSIARQYTKHLYHYPWDDNFSNARNYSLSKATGKWILVLDADELLNPHIIPPIQQLLQNPHIIAINLIRQEINAQQAPYTTVCRLFRNRPDLKFWGIYHESIDHALAQLLHKYPQYKLAHLEQIAIAHYGYTKHNLDRQNKYKFAERLMTKHLTAYPNDPYMQNKLGALKISQGDYTQGIQLLLKSWQTLETTPDQNNLKFEVLYHLGHAYEELQEWQIAQIYYEQALQIPTHPLTLLPAWNNLGAVYYHQKDYQSAIVCYQESISIDPQCKEAYHNLGLALRANGELDTAHQAYLHALHLDPTYACAHQNLGALLLAQGKIPESQHHLQQAIHLYHQQGDHQAAQQLANLISTSTAPLSPREQ